MYTGTLPYIEVHPEIRGRVEPGEFLSLKCKATGKGSLHYVWLHQNQTLVEETRPELIIKGVKESDQGGYRCRVTNAFGYAMSDPATLRLSKCSIFSILEFRLGKLVSINSLIRASMSELHTSELTCQFCVYIYIVTCYSVYFDAVI